MATEARKKVLVVLGAGASHDVWDKSIPLKSKDWKPPLATGLFDFESHPHYYTSVLSAYPGAQNLASEIAQGDSYRTPGFDLEATLRQFADHPQRRTRRWFLELPAYIRDVVYRASTDYVHVPSNYVTLLRRLVEDEPKHSVAFLSLNYDTLVEQALERFGVNYADINRYAKSNAEFGPFVKLHGSIDWFRGIGMHDTWFQCLDHLELKNLAHGPIVRDERQLTIAGTLEEQHLYPVLTAPLAGKSPDHYVCPESHVTALETWLIDCEKLLVIGCSGLDDNLITLLRRSLKSIRSAHIVGSKDVSDAANRFERVGSVAALGSALVHTPVGFHTYVRGPLFSKFVAS